MNTVIFTLRLPGLVRKDLKKISKEEKIPIGQIIREALERYIAVKRFRSLRKKTLPFAEAQGLITDEDVFEAIS
ncbi:MAG: CopG family transcriptional regulator [Elusimicrobia bacterium]|nr:CopG family transcriptional regulator [Elusimicrobiota bacterium]